MRKFYIENEKNERFSLWGNRIYFVEPTGLGIKHNISYIRVGNSYLSNKKNIAQSKIGGKIEFLNPGADKRFRDFYDFCAAASSLHLVYDPGDGVEYLRDIDILNVDKTEKTGGTLPISISFSCKSLYYLKNNNRFIFEKAECEKRYDYQYDYTYSDYGTHEAIINNNGHVEAPFECTIYGYVANPTIRVVKDKKIIYEVVFPVVVEIGEFIRYSSRDGHLEATLVSGNKETNLMNTLDIMKDNFFKIPVGNSTLVFSSSSESTNVIMATVYKMFEVV